MLCCRLLLSRRVLPTAVDLVVAAGGSVRDEPDSGLPPLEATHHLLRLSLSEYTDNVFVVRAPLEGAPTTVPGEAEAPAELRLQRDVETRAVMRLGPSQLAGVLSAISPAHAAAVLRSGRSTHVFPQTPLALQERAVLHPSATGSAFAWAVCDKTVTLESMTAAKRFLIHTTGTFRTSKDGGTQPALTAVTLRAVILDDSLLFQHAWGMRDGVSGRARLWGPVVLDAAQAVIATNFLQFALDNSFGFHKAPQRIATGSPPGRSKT